MLRWTLHGLGPPLHNLALNAMCGVMTTLTFSHSNGMEADVSRPDDTERETNPPKAEKQKNEKEPRKAKDGGGTFRFPLSLFVFLLLRFRRVRLVNELLNFRQKLVEGR